MLTISLSDIREVFHKGYYVEFLSNSTGNIDVNSKVGAINSKELHKVTLITQSLKFSNEQYTGSLLFAFSKHKECPKSIILPGIAVNGTIASKEIINWILGIMNSMSNY